MELTPTEQRLLDVLDDGCSHHRRQLKACLDDDLAGWSCLAFHLHTLRKKLRRVGEDVIYERRHEGTFYRKARLLSMQ